MTHLLDKATDHEVLQAAIEKAIKNGWNNHTFQWQDDKANWAIGDLGVSYPFGYSFVEVRFKWYDKDTERLTGSYAIHLNDLLFDHEFCKALWGSRTINALNGNKFVAKKLPPGVIEVVYVDLAWEYHLKRLALAEDRIDYLRKNLP